MASETTATEEKKSTKLDVSYSLSEDVLVSWNQDAEAGSEESQLNLGLHYLKLTELDINKEENTALALKWLIQASKQGNEDATDKLRHCVETDLGVTDINKGDITWCLNTSASEKKIRYAARSLFHKLNAAHKGALSKDEYINAINTLTVGNEKERKLLLAAGKKIGSTITENDFVKTVSKKIQGTLTLTSEEVQDRSAAYESAGIVKKVFVYPRETARIAFEQGLEYASKEGMSVVLSLIPTNQIYLLAMVFAYSFLTPQLFLLVVPLLVFYISVMVVLISTLQMFYKRRKQREATTLTSLLQEQLNVDLDVDSAESQYSWNSLTPYLVYFATIPMVILSFSLAVKAYIPCSELFVMCIAITGVCFIGLSDSHDLVTIIALGSHGFASLPMFLSHFPDIPVISSLVHVITGPFFTFDLGFGVTFNLSLPSFVHLMIPFLFVQMAMKHSWSGSYRIVIPHLICYLWFSFATIVYPYTTLKSLARATVGYFLLPVLLPLGAVLFFFGILYLLYLLLQTEMIGKLVVTGILIAIPILLTQTKAFVGKKEKKVSPKMKKIKTILMIVFSVLAILPLLFVQLPSLGNKKAIELPWEEYKDMCLPGEGETMAPFQLRCRSFLGVKVHWVGTVEEVKLIKIDNTPESVIKSLPTLISDPLVCLYGEPIPECDSETMSEKSLKHCQLLKDSGQICHLNSHNVLTLNLMLDVNGVKVNLQAGSNFQSRLMALEKGDQLDFTGSLTEVGGPNPGLKLKSMKCTSRELPVMVDLEDDIDEDVVMKLVNEALTTVFNFGFFPVLTYTTGE